MTVAQLYAQPALLSLPMVGLVPISVAEANRLLVAWGHRLGEMHRPFTVRAYALELDGRPISMAMSASTVSDVAAGYLRTEIVECARLCSEPGNKWANRVMIRLWREVCAPRWPDWPVKAAISYSVNAMHTGNLYRLDGWECVKTDAGGSRGGGTWTRKREADEPVVGNKSLWRWRYDR